MPAGPLALPRHKVVEAGGHDFVGLAFHADGSGGRDARTTVKLGWTEGMDQNAAVELAIQGLYEAADEDSATGGPDAVRGIYPTVATITANGYQEIDRDVRLMLKEPDPALISIIANSGAGRVVPKTAFEAIDPEPVATVEQLVDSMSKVQEVYVSEVFVKHCVELVRRTRTTPHLDLGSSPRAGIALVQAARARAFIHGRDYAVPEDLFALAEDVLLHRMRLTYQAMAEGLTAQHVLRQIMAEVS